MAKQDLEKIYAQDREDGRRIMEETQRIFAKAGWTPENVAKELALIGFADMASFVQIDEQGSVKPLPIEDLKDKSRIIKKIREKRRILNGKDDDTILEDTFEFELHDKLEALKLGMAVQGMQKPQEVNVNHSGSVIAEVVAQKMALKNGCKDKGKVKKSSLKRKQTRSK